MSKRDNKEKKNFFFCIYNMLSLELYIFKKKKKKKKKKI